VTTDISAVIARLDDPSTDIAEDAKYTLIAQGTLASGRARPAALD
jgi:hypothetical protein